MSSASRRAVEDGNAWRMFRIMGEFAAGFQLLADMPLAVAVFGSARTASDHPHYQQAVEVAGLISQRGFPVITGGGPGIMEAGNKGAKEAGGRSVGLCIKLPFEQRGNAFITDEEEFHYFFVRKVMFLKHTCAIVCMPGGFGTLDELFETVTLVQTHKIKPIPIVLYGRDYWTGLLDWMRATMQDQYAYISPGDLDLMTIADTPEEVLQALAHLQPSYQDISVDLP